ncbi:MAG: type II secretion system protein [Verrucomicrobia bacterium]|nr:type II secretion system protein [Verrucomicrobiota bacterium]
MELAASEGAFGGVGFLRGNLMQTPFYRRQSAFTLIELMVVISILGLLMTMVLGVQRYAQTKSNRGRAEAEIAALCAAAEAYKADQGTYPRSGETDALKGVNDSAPVEPSGDYKNANLSLYSMLTGDADFNGKPDSMEGKPGATPLYMTFKGSQLSWSGGAAGNGTVLFIRDPWGKAYPYGYSTARNAALERDGRDDPSAGHNITFDVWSIAASPDKPAAWISNW